jgi:type VI protein secretion system component VasK
VKISPDFENFFNRAAALSDAIYNGSPTPHMAFTLKQASTNIGDLTLKIGSDSLSGTGQQKTFTWTGVPAEIQVTTPALPINNYSSGPWSVFRFINDGHPQNKNATTTELNYTVRQSNGQEVMKNGQKLFYTYDLTFGGASPLRLSDFSGLRCTAQVAR